LSSSGTTNLLSSLVTASAGPASPRRLTDHCFVRGDVSPVPQCNALQ
jgi:hypothetical protein